MKVLIVYYSFHHENTKKIAKVIAHQLKAKMVNPSDEEVKKWEEYDLIGFGSGIYKGKYHESIMELIEKLPSVEDRKTFVFSTSAYLHNYNKAAKEKLSAKGFKVIGEFSCQGFETYGPFGANGGLNKGRPNREDFQNAQTFAQSLQ